MPAPSTRPPAAVGDPLDAIDTPALLVDLDAMERNLAAMQSTARAAGVALRPHAKAHKCAAIAARQLAAGAVGVCVQKVDEACAMVEAGVADVFVSNEVAGAAKLDRLARLARSARVALAVDCDAGVEAAEQAARRAGVRLRAFVEVDVGQHRCGIEPGEPAARLAARIAQSASLHFAGLHAYHGGAQHLRTPAERRDAIAQAAQAVRVTLDAITARGLRCETVTGAGTGTFAHEAASNLWTEIQPGSYVFMDADYRRNRPDAGAPRFEQSLWLLAAVMSRPTGHAVVDAGLKAHSVDSGMPEVDLPGWRYEQASDEHGVLVPAPGAAPLAWGERVRLAPGHCDPTVNLHDWLVAVRGGRVEALWPVEARGAVR